MSGIEWIVEAHGCEPRALADIDLMRALFARMIEDLGLRPVHEHSARQHPSLLGAHPGLSQDLGLALDLWRRRLPGAQVRVIRAAHEAIRDFSVTLEELLLLALRTEQPGHQLGSAGAQSVGQIIAFHVQVLSMTILPTQDTRAVIESAFAAADGEGGELVSTLHLLIGMFGQPDSSGVQVLESLGVTQDRARTELGKVIAESVAEASKAPTPRPVRPVAPPLGMPATSGVAAVFETARRVAQKEGAPLIRSDHLLAAVLGRGDQRSAVQALLVGAGTDLAAVRRRLRPPRAVTRMEARIQDATRQKVEALARRDYELAARLRSDEKGMQHELTKALDRWQAGWATPSRARAGGGTARPLTGRSGGAP